MPDKNQQWFSLALDRSTDISGLLFILEIDKNYEVYEELLEVFSFHDTTTRENIFEVENDVQNSLEKDLTEHIKIHE